MRRLAPVASQSVRAALLEIPRQRRPKGAFVLLVGGAA